MYKNTEDKSFMSKSEMEDKIVSLLGGRVAEQLILNDISTGASNDIERASKIARNMVMRYGMSEKLGAITFGNDQEEVFLGRDINNVKNYSDEIAAVIDVEVKNIIDKGYNRAKTILQQHIDKLHKVAAVLLEKEKITEKHRGAAAVLLHLFRMDIQTFYRPHSSSVSCAYSFSGSCWNRCASPSAVARSATIRRSSISSSTSSRSASVTV